MIFDRVKDSGWIGLEITTTDGVSLTGECFSVPSQMPLPVVGDKVRWPDPKGVFVVVERRFGFSTIVVGDLLSMYVLLTVECIVDAEAGGGGDDAA